MADTESDRIARLRTLLAEAKTQSAQIEKARGRFEHAQVKKIQALEAHLKRYNEMIEATHQLKRVGEPMRELQRSMEASAKRWEALQERFLEAGAPATEAVERMNKAIESENQVQEVVDQLSRLETVSPDLKDLNSQVAALQSRLDQAMKNIEERRKLGGEEVTEEGG